MEVWYKDGKIKLAGANKEIALKKGVFQHICITTCPGKIKLYIDGKKVQEYIDKRNK